MKFRRRLRSRHTRRPGMKGDWIILAGTPCPVVMPAPVNCTSTPFDMENVATFSLITSSDLIVKEDAMTIVRIVGEIDHYISVQFNNSGAGWNETHRWSLHEGIYVATDDSAGNILGLDPREILDMESDMWMWQRHRRVAIDTIGSAGGTARATVGFHDYSAWNANMGDHIDIRVKRRLKQGQELIYGAAWLHDGVLNPQGSTTTTIVADFTPHLRGYVKF